MHAPELAEFIDEKVEDVEHILAAGRRMVTGETEFLRCFGILRRIFYHKPTWCLLGEGPLPITMANSGDVSDAISAEPNGITCECRSPTTNVCGILWVICVDGVRRGLVS